MADPFETQFPETDFSEVSNEDVEAVLRAQEEARLAAEQPPLAEQPPEQPSAEQPSTGEAPPEPPTPPAPPSDAWEYEEYDPQTGQPLKRAITRDQAQGFARFRDHLAAHPELQQKVAALLQGEYDLVPKGSGDTSGQPSATAPPAAPPTTTPPPGLDLDDPAIKYLWDQHVAQQQAIAEQQRQFAEFQNQFGEATQYLLRHEAQLTEQARTTGQSLVNRARASYKEQHQLTDDQMEHVYEIAGRLQVLPSLMSEIDPVTGQPRQVDPLNAMEQAFDLALMTVPELRDRELQRVADENRKDLEKKQKLSALGGSGGSVPRQPAVPTTQHERRQAMIQEVAGFMQGNQE